MLIYAVADIHADMRRMMMIRENIAAHEPDVLVVAGDLFNYTRTAPVLKALDDMPVPVFAVRGNSDPAWHEKRFAIYPNLTSLHLKRVDAGGFSFTGIGGTLPVPFRSRFRLRERAVLERAGRMVDRKTVLVVHPPPYGMLDQVMGRFSAGAKGVSSLISERRPWVVICGHIHEAAGAACIDQTLVVNCSIARSGHGALIRLDGGHPPVARML